MDSSALTEFVNASSADDELVRACWVEADALVGNLIAGSERVPGSIRDRAVLEVGAELFHRRNAPGGITQFAVEGASPVRMARDPMVAAYPLLRPFLPAGLA